MMRLHRFLLRLLHPIARRMGWYSVAALPMVTVTPVSSTAADTIDQTLIDRATAATAEHEAAVPFDDLMQTWADLAAASPAWVMNMRYFGTNRRLTKVLLVPSDWDAQPTDPRTLPPFCLDTPVKFVTMRRLLPPVGVDPRWN